MGPDPARMRAVNPVYIPRNHLLDEALTAAEDGDLTAVHRLLEHLGLRCEARLVDADWFKGEWTTLRIYAVLAREWR